MAEKKYDLALVDTVSMRPIKHQQWYKERLDTKYLKSLKSGEKAKYLNTDNWIFLKDGLDDFRDGLPPAVEGGDFVENVRGPIFNIHGNVNNQVKAQAAPRRLNRYQSYFSKSTPQQQQKRDYIDEVEQGLLKHPLALYPHLEECVTPEIFEEIVDLLDPQFNIQDINEEEEEEMLETVEEKNEDGRSSRRSTRSGSSAKSARDSEHNSEISVRQLYRWRPKKETKDKKDGNKSKTRTDSPSQEEHIKKVTEDFCEWVSDLGGESNNIEESTITSLFASGYETKPALSVPIHVVELTNVPQELRMSAAVNPPATPARQPTIEEKALERKAGKYEPSWVKFKYGAWYLNPQTWEKRNWDEPLVDPKEIKNQEASQAKKRSDTLNQELALIHASKAFSEFITKKSCRRPEFLSEVSEIQQRAEEEEMKREESELAARYRRTGTGRGLR